MPTLNEPIYYPSLTPEQNTYLAELRASYTANGSELTDSQQTYLDSLIETFQLETEEGFFDFELVLDEEGNTDTLGVRVG